MKNDNFDPDKLPDFVFPAQLLRQIEESSYQGNFALFVRDAHGNVKSITNFGNNVEFAGVVNYIAAWALASLQANSENIGNSVYRDSSDSPEEEP